MIASDADPTEIVCKGYDDISYRYRDDDDTPASYVSLVAELIDHVPTPGPVLDLGCGQLDAESYRQLMVTAGLEVAEQRFVSEGSSGHSLFWARRPA